MLFAAGLMLPVPAFNAAAGIKISASDKNFITFPMFGMPAIWLKNSTDDPYVAIDSSLTDTDFPWNNSETWSVFFRKSKGPVFFEEEIAVAYVENDASKYFLHLSIPQHLPVDLYDLEVSLKTGKTVCSSCQPNAVKIIEKRKDHYLAVHVTDIHVDDFRGSIRNYSETEGYKAIKKMMHMVNLLDPEFVIITGDHVFGMSYMKEYPHLYDLLQGFDVPIFMSIGNHDAINHSYSMAIDNVDGLKIFEDNFAPLNFTFRYGALKYISLNTMDWSALDRKGKSIFTMTPGGQTGTAQLDWFESELAVTDASLILVGYHHPPQNSFLGDGSYRVMELAREYNVDLVLTGHTHSDAVSFDDDVIYLTTASLSFNEFDGSYPAFRILEVQDNELVSWNYEEPRWSVPVYMNSSPYSPLWNLSTPALFSVYSPSNNGNHSTVTASITNSLVDNYSELSLEFVVPVPSSNRTYKVTNGEVVDMYDTGAHQIWYVKTDISAESCKEVTITDENR